MKKQNSPGKPALVVVELTAEQLRSVTGGAEAASEDNESVEELSLLTGAIQRASDNGRKTVRQYGL